MSLIPPEALNSGHCVSPFDCGKPVLNDWLVRHALQAQASGSAKTFVVADSDLIVGYFSLTVGQVDTLEAPKRIRKGMGQYPIPVVLLARLAVSLHHQGCGIGRGLLQDAICRTLVMTEHAGIRALLAHPIDEDATRFYLRFGFVVSPLRERQLLLLLKDARRLFLTFNTASRSTKLPASSSMQVTSPQGHQRSTAFGSSGTKV